MNIAYNDLERVGVWCPDLVSHTGIDDIARGSI